MNDPGGTARLRYLLDTNVMSPLLTATEPHLTRRIAEVGEATVCTSTIVLGELRFGAQLAQRPDLMERIDHLTRRMTILPLADATAESYGHLRAELRRQGIGVSANDLWIAAQALTFDLTLVTRNEREFERIPGLRVRDWTPPSSLGER